MLCGALGWLTFGLTTVVCGIQNTVTVQHSQFFKGASQPHWVSLRGAVYDLTNFLSWHESLDGFKNGLYSKNAIDVRF